MPSFFSFEQGNESRSRFPTGEASPLLGRFRAVPRDGRSNRRGSLGLLTHSSWRNSVHIGHGYGALISAGLDDEAASSDDDEFDDETRPAWVRWCRRQWRAVDELWINPKQTTVNKVARVWWSRWAVLVVLPAVLAVGWCAIPFPQYPLGDDEDWDGHNKPGGGGDGRRRTPGHGEAKVEVNFWFFVFVYYAFYNLTALVWITKVFNLYSLNWWPSALGFPLTICLIATLGTAGPIVLYHIPEANFLTTHNTVWISWTFCIMAMPVMIASCILLTRERHMGLRHSLSETQRIFTSSWWTGEDDGPDLRANGRRQQQQQQQQRRRRAEDLWGNLETPDIQVNGLGVADHAAPRRVPVRLRPRFFPASFVRFLWFCTALLIGLLAYVIGEAYAEVYLRTLPHSSLDTIVYVYGWILTVYLLDGLTGWILGGNQGERVGSYPLSWVFKLYFMLTYQTYVRALYARLRSPQQFILLQVLSSSGLIILTPILLSAPFHWVLTVLGMNGQSYAAYQKIGVRNVFIRFLAENTSMLCFLGSVVVLHFGANKDVYPYFSFDEDPSKTGDPYNYTFELTFYASAVTWACELVASFIVAGLIRWIYKVDVVAEGSLDLAVWPELLPTSVVVVLHVLQNMLFSIVRLQFR
ncbi:hypothetical protein M406DRAFT_280208 [Cryphonectria parasitica EP155]|uniref:Uncharacterized protein n=1 Tax=Cryphonectria parasitica (strain ATCC 38755 / EP155) TaxID=660469 RepID=A0A9P4XVP3_CRYP1|nr:uncharacterized protein M406DRAFT_280208 [Cryphonectria parasitica EP155]KAF3762159.1 hypothetical protein M406DRAFT_280208 [Cryphonectria parasitica EP155]